MLEDINTSLLKAERNTKYILSKLEIDYTWLDLEEDEGGKIKLLNLPIAPNYEDQFSLKSFVDGLMDGFLL